MAKISGHPRHIRTNTSISCGWQEESSAHSSTSCRFVAGKRSADKTSALLTCIEPWWPDIRNENSCCWSFSRWILTSSDRNKVNLLFVCSLRKIGAFHCVNDGKKKKQHGFFLIKKTNINSTMTRASET